MVFRPTFSRFSMTPNGNAMTGLQAGTLAKTLDLQRRFVGRSLVGDLDRQPTFMTLPLPMLTLRRSGCRNRLRRGDPCHTKSSVGVISDHARCTILRLPPGKPTAKLQNLLQSP